MLIRLSVSCLSFRFSFCIDFKCDFGLYFPPFTTQNPYPKNFIPVGLLTLLFSALTFNQNFFSIYFVIDVKTLFATFSLFTNIIQSSANLTKFSSLASSSFNIMLLSNGLKFPPCDIPTFVGSYLPFYITPLTRIFMISDTTLPSFTVFIINPISLS